ncbi:MAG: septum site-determining protein MinC [Dictyoglomaceae bacterium]|nr:septum site-determining protein MinC [Dictyoglomaceae bacterium]
MGKIVIKGDVKEGLKLIVDPNLTWEETKELIWEELSKKESFLKGSSINIDLKNRKIDEEDWINFQQKVFKEFGIMLYKEIFTTKLEDKNIAQIILGPIRSGQRVYSKNSLLIIGDVNPGSEILSEKNIFVLGKIRGSVYAGMEKNRKALIFGLNLDPVHMQIADVIWEEEKILDSSFGYWVYIEDEKLKISINIL